jgi:NitT/TauT family transport system substrate-binding protein
MVGLSVSATAEEIPITFSLDFRPLGRHAAWYVAVAKGFYRDAGLDVKIIGSGGTAQALQSLETNVAQFAFSDVAGLATATANGATTAKMVAVIYQKAPYTIFSLKSGANVSRIEQLEGLNVGSGAGSFTQTVIHALMLEKHLDPARVTYTNVDPSARVSMLVAGKIPAVESFAMSMPAIVSAVGADEARMYLLADGGVHLYSNGIVVRSDFLTAHSDIVRGFVAASLQGWRYTMAHPDEAAEIVSAAIKGLDEKVARAEIGIVDDLVETPATRVNGLGSIDQAVMQDSIDLILGKDAAAAKKINSASISTSDFLPPPPKQ